MKTRTRVVAWFYILIQLPVLVAVAVLALTGGSMAALPGIFGKHDIGVQFTGSVFILTAVIEGLCFLISVLPWICLLKKHPWAWWLLSILYTGGTVIWVAGMLALLLLEHAKARAAFMEMLPYLIAFVPTFLILITDRPSMWKKRRSPARRRGRRPSSYRSRRS